MSASALPKRLLWVDGEIDFLRAHIQYLESQGYSVERASVFEAALDLLRSARFDLVLLDEQLVGKEGVGAAAKLRLNAPNIPILLVTKNDDERVIQSTWGKEIDGFTGKPVHPALVLAAVKSILLARRVRNTPPTSAYVRTREAIKSDLLAAPSPAKWEKIHFQLSKWDVEMPEAADSGLEEMHRVHKRDLSKRFLGYLEEHYVGWVGKAGGNPNLHTQTVRRKLLPPLQRKKPAALVVLSGLRFDQWIRIQKIVEPWFKVENAAAWALLPSEKDVCRAALFSGRLPRDVSLDQPQLWKKLREDADPVPCERELLKMQLRKLGLDLDDPGFLHARTLKDCAGLKAGVQKLADSPLIVIVVEFLDLLRSEQSPRLPPPEEGPSEHEVRAKALETFKTSGLADALKALAAQNRTVVVTADHGSVRVDTPSEVFCQEEQSSHPRVKTGPDISCDERQALFVEAPQRYGLPGEAGETAYAIAKGRFYFVYPNKFQYFVTPYKDQMVSGGISLEELIVPLATLTPLASMSPPAPKEPT